MHCFIHKTTSKHTPFILCLHNGILLQTNQEISTVSWRMQIIAIRIRAANSHSNFPYVSPLCRTYYSFTYTYPQLYDRFPLHDLVSVFPSYKP
jgi:hypothetical protein